MSAKVERWLLIAASSRGAAEAYAARNGISVALMLDRHDLLAPPWQLREKMRTAAIDRAAIHSIDWGRERAPQLAELALGLAPVKSRVLIDEATEAIEDRGRLLAPSVAARLPFELIGAATIAGTEVLRLLRRPRVRPVERRPAADPARVLAIWPFSSGEVGGAVTHMSGILAGFRRAGIRVGLVSPAPVAEQLAGAIDEIEVATPLSRGSRVWNDTESLAANRALTAAAQRLAAHFKPDFVYQRNSAFLGVGPRLAAGLEVPLVLEWNASEAWRRRNWDRPPFWWLPPLERLVALSERRALEAATVVVAVSARAATMASDRGATPERLAIVPNGVDIAAVDAALARSAPPATRTGFLIGWVGSFGPWHGAPVLVRAMCHLPRDIGLRMIGDGQGRQAVRALADELGVADRIEWSGTLPHPDALASLAQCDVLASPHVPASDSPFFGSPTKLFEYMALGRPIVASRLEQIGEVLDHERTAILVEPGDDHELAAAIARVFNRPDRGTELGRAAAEEARRLHTWDRRASEVLGALRERS